jgi:RNA polymerase sigma-70 factor, ECF subfamily
MTAWTETQVTTTLSPRRVAAPVARPTGTVPVQRAAGSATATATTTTTATAAAAAEAEAEELFRRHYPKLAGWVRRLVDDDDTAHEIASESFVRLLSRPVQVDSPQRYLYAIATNLTKDHWRKTGRERRAINRVTSVAVAEPVIYPTQDVDVRHLVASLPSRLREPFLLHYYGGFGIREVAGLLRKPEGTIKANLFAARAKLKAALAEGDL